MADFEPPCYTAAKECIARGLAVMPLKPGTKEPATVHGTKDASDNPEQAEFWWRQGAYAGDARGDPDCNIGVACGEPSHGFFAIDFDTHEGSGNGLDFKREWEVENGELPETWTAITGSGGLQMYYRSARDIRNSSNQSIGVDVRGRGGFVVFPPSLHPCGEHYEWSVSPDDCELADADDTVYRFLDAVQPVKRGEDGWRADRVEVPDRIATDRNDRLFSIGRSFLSKGIDHATVETMVRALNAERCDPPLGEAELRKLIGSINSKEPGNAERDARNGGVTAADIAELESRHGPLHGSRGGLNSNVLARMVMDRNMARIIDGAPAVWTGEHWEFGSHAIGKCCLEIADNAKKADKSEVLSYIMDKAPHVSADNSFDGRHYVQFKNCTFDVMEWREVEPSPSMYITNKLPVELDFTIGPNEADAFLDSIADGDADVVAALKEVMGACMCSKRVLSQSPMLIGRAGGASGKASNGKSTFLNWLRQILGTENVSSLDISTLGQRFQAGRVVGKLANLGDDIPDGFLKGDELSIFKKLVTGDSIFTDVKNGDGFEFRPAATMVFSMNAVPRLSDTTDGVFRRLHFIPFRSRFAPGTPGYDPDMPKRLARPEVMRRGALLGLTALNAMLEEGIGLHPVPDMVAEVEEVRQDNDSVLRWLYDCGVTAEALDGRVVATVYDEYKQWCDESGERNPFARRTWTSRVKEAVTFCHVQDGNALEVASVRPDGLGKTARTFVLSRSD